MKTNDLISRAAIEWHDFLVADGNGMYHEEKVAYKRQIDTLPSAQPEPCDDPRADVYYLAEEIGIHRLYALVVELRGEPEPCEDAVSREAVLDMLHQECSSIVENFMKEKINAMPSVTPNQYEIIHCRECKHLIDHRCRKIRTLDDWRKPGDFCSYAERR